jgi:hypothetical protein
MQSLSLWRRKFVKPVCEPCAGYTQEVEWDVVALEMETETTSDGLALLAANFDLIAQRSSTDDWVT